MTELIPAPDPRTSLPPLLACLPTAFASRRPPPALSPLVTPIIRQRLQLLTSGSPSASENWLRLLCWDRERAEGLVELVKNSTFDPHPSSGEIEVGEIGLIKYKRLDQDTLQAQIVLDEWRLIALYLWCGEDEGGGGWRLAELLPLDSLPEEDSTWSHSISVANEDFRSSSAPEALGNAEVSEWNRVPPEDDEEYWGQYEKTTSLTPTQNAPGAAADNPADPRVGHSEVEYYAKYGQVQPALDNHDPSEESKEFSDSSLQGDILTNVMNQKSHMKDVEGNGLATLAATSDRSVRQPHPASSEAVARPEASVDQQPIFESGIKEHITTSMKSLFRLATNSGMGRERFNSLVQKELETNSMVDE